MAPATCWPHRRLKPADLYTVRGEWSLYEIEGALPRVTFTPGCAGRLRPEPGNRWLRIRNRCREEPILTGRDIPSFAGRRRRGIIPALRCSSGWGTPMPRVSRCTCRSPQTGWLVLRDRYDPDWQAHIDGRRSKSCGPTRQPAVPSPPAATGFGSPINRFRSGSVSCGDPEPGGWGGWPSGCGHGGALAAEAGSTDGRITTGHPRNVTTESESAALGGDIPCHNLDGSLEIVARMSHSYGGIV